MIMAWCNFCLLCWCHPTICTRWQQSVAFYMAQVSFQKKVNRSASIVSSCCLALSLFIKIYIWGCGSFLIKAFLSVVYFAHKWLEMQTFQTFFLPLHRLSVFHYKKGVKWCYLHTLVIVQQIFINLQEEFVFWNRAFNTKRKAWNVQ